MIQTEHRSLDVNQHFINKQSNFKCEFVLKQILMFYIYQEVGVNATTWDMHDTYEMLDKDQKGMI